MGSKKGFDCVEMKRHSQTRIYAETKGMSVDEQLDYWKKHDEAFKRQLAGGKAKTRRQPKSVKS
jgi:hypothetical protein